MKTKVREPDEFLESKTVRTAIIQSKIPCIVGMILTLQFHNRSMQANSGHAITGGLL